VLRAPLQRELRRSAARNYHPPPSPQKDCFQRRRVLDFGWFLRDAIQTGPALSVSGSSSAVERQLPKLDVAGSIPVSRSIFSID